MIDAGRPVLVVPYAGAFERQALVPADAVAAELGTAAAPDLAMLVVAGRQLRQALG